MQLTHKKLVGIAAKWLSANHCVVCTELAIVGEEADVIGWRSGRSTLVEAKASRADFMADTDGMWESQQERSEFKKWGWSSDSSWWETEPDVGRVVHGVPYRVDRIRCLGNSVVPQSAKAAFKELAGIND